jgi:catechol 2,3-dioxygenase-like lactoylglutathione lyase family enzyme
MTHLALAVGDQERSRRFYEQGPVREVATVDDARHVV